MLDRTLAAALLLLFAWATPASALQIRLAPGDTVLRGDPVSVLIEGAAANARVEVAAERRYARGVFRSAAVFVADADGRIDTRTTPAVAGGYTGVDEAGIFWSMRRTPDATTDVADGHVRITARTADAAPVSAVLAFRESDPRVVERAVPELPGATLYRIDDDADRPAIIVLGGSEGGAGHGREIGPALASRGYVALGLPYYSPDWGRGREIADLPRSFIDIRVERLAEARAWLRRQPRVRARSIGLWGVSKGAEFALLGAARYRWVAATAAIVPTDVVWEGWGPDSRGAGQSSSFSWGGRSLPFVPYADADLYFGAFARGERPTVTLAEVHARGRAANASSVAPARIDAARYSGALLVAGGRRDEIWPSGEMAAAIAQRREEAGRRTLTFVYEAAGHGLAGPGFVPTAEHGSGGDPAANGRAQVEVWRAALAMYARALRPPGVGGGSPAP